uniref:Uncharacterized protein n=1 Tax=Scytodes thoracica TaxID=1112478 RepID=A0A0A0VCI3_SCYTH|nr:hypothetical protein [Scytodes thoracica]
MERPPDVRFSDYESKIALSRFLISELQAAKLIYVKQGSGPQKIIIEVPESPVARELREMVVALNFRKPPPTITSIQMFSKLEEKILYLMSKEKIPGSLEPHFGGRMTPKEWFQLRNIYDSLYEEYSSRRQLLITRLDVTIQSFEWSSSSTPTKRKLEHLESF